MAKVDPQVLRHKEWLGLLQPVGLVVAPVALVKGQAVPSKNVTEQQRTLIEVTGGSEVKPKLSFERFALEVLEWQPEDLVGAGDTEVPSDLDVALTEYREVLSPTFAVPDPAEDGKWLLLVKEVEDELDRATDASKQGWHTSPQVRFERLLRDNEVPIGILANAENVRLVYAPTGESSGHLTFPVSAMREVAGRPMLAALLMLLGSDRLFTLPDDRRLPTLLSESRKYQNVVSTELSQQVLRALGELLRGFQAADNAMNGDLLNDAMREDPQHIYGGLITVLMRLVFLLYAEERDLLPGDDVYQEHYAVTGLFEKLRSDAALYPDTMDQRYGAWARLLSLFRLIFDGGQHGTMSLPARQGQLFQPDEYPFLEGRPYRSVRQLDELLSPPRVSDGTIYRVLEDLLVLDGERLSYRTLDVEQIGSVYEAIMGFEVKRAMAPSIGVRPEHVVVNLQEILDTKPAQRAKALQAQAACSIPKGALKDLKAAATTTEVVAAISSRISPQTPSVLPVGALFLQPTEERRRSGSHYTPRALTEPIVSASLRPILEGLGTAPTPAQILGLKICDAAMGSGAFLVEACRHVADQLVVSWAVHEQTPTIPPDEDVVLHARRLVAQRCLYGVDRNRFAVNLAKLSLWLVTLAKDHPFTFIDHALKHGDSLIGLTKSQIAGFHWNPDLVDDHDLPLFQWMASQIGQAHQARASLSMLDDESENAKRLRHQEAEEALEDARLAGDFILSAYFTEDKSTLRERGAAKAREERRSRLSDQHHRLRTSGKGRQSILDQASEMRAWAKPVIPFHWEVEFPEVFSGDKPGFDAFVGNPPFLGGTRIGGQLGLSYHDYLVERYGPATGLADLSAFFLRRAYDLLAEGGTFGLIATNTIAQGDTRTSGLAEIVKRRGTIYEADRRRLWPGTAAVVVSVIHVRKGLGSSTIRLDGREVPSISSFLLRGSVEDTPQALRGSYRICFRGTKIWGSGFLFDADPSKGESTIDEMNRLIVDDPTNREVISKYIGGQEFNASPTQSPHRYVIDFGEMPEAEARRWPALFSIVEEKVKPVRSTNKQRNYRELWWQHANRVQEVPPFVAEHGRILALTCVSPHISPAFVDGETVVADSMMVFLLHRDEDFALIQSRPHEIWARFLGSSMKDDLRYTTPCYETFPRPTMSLSEVAAAGREYYDYRQRLMISNDEGLTKTYNRFHNPDEISEGINKLRQLHDAMDRAVLDSYGWADLHPTAEFLLDYEVDEDESSRKRKPWRFRWPDEVQEEVLSRLLALNQERADKERQTNGDTPKGPRARRKPSKKRRSKASKRKSQEAASQSQTSMFQEDLK